MATNAAGDSTGATTSVAPIGGPDVTVHLLSIRRHLRQWYFALTPKQQADFRNQWIETVAGAAWSHVFDQEKLGNNSNNWDIEVLKAQIASTRKNLGVLPDGTCTVTVAGHVYPDEEVNYWLRGVIGEMLGWDEGKTHMLTIAYRIQTYGGTGIAGRLAWTSAGFQNDPTVPIHWERDLSGYGYMVYESSAITGVSPATGEDTGPLKWYAGTAPNRVDGSD